MHHYFSVALQFPPCSGFQGIVQVICALSTSQSFTGCGQTIPWFSNAPRKFPYSEQVFQDLLKCWPLMSQ